MEYLPKTKQQKEFEELIDSMVLILSNLTEHHRQKVLDYIIQLYNKEVKTK